MTLINTDPIEQTRLSDGRALGSIRRRELRELCREMDLPITEVASADIMRALIASQIWRAVEDKKMEAQRRENERLALAEKQSQARREAHAQALAQDGAVQAVAASGEAEKALGKVRAGLSKVVEHKGGL